MPSLLLRTSSALVATLAAATVLPGQVRQPVALADYGKFETLVQQRRGGLSPDGRWLAVGVNRSNREHELRIVSAATGEARTVAFGSQPAFSADSQWVAYAVGYSDAQEDQLRKDKKPVHRKLGTLSLASGEMTTVDGIESFAFDASGAHLAMKRYPPERKDPPEAAAANPDEAPAGATVIVRDLASGRDVTFGNVTEFTWEETGGRPSWSDDGRTVFVGIGHYWTIDTATRATVNITKGVPASFVDRESDSTVKQKPPFGVAGWTGDDKAVILYDKLDAWMIAPDGSKATRLTDGSASQIRYRYVQLDPDEEWIETSQPIHFSQFGIWSKKSGYARLDAGASRLTPLVLEDKSLTGLDKARDASVYAYAVQSFDQPPQLMVGGADLSSARAVVSTNPFAGDYAWGTSTIVEYKNERGERLQGALFYPAGYQPGRKYPMVVYMYERLSDGVHRWSSPSDREPCNPAVFTSLGYILLQPDISFRPRDPGLSVADCVGAAVERVIAMGVVDPARIGIIGHSWGGFDTVFLATHTNLFAAGIAGAPITDLVSNYGNHHWNGGVAETDHIETGQQRMEGPLWEDLPAYIRNSAVFGISTMKTPLLLAFGDNDGTVHWHQGVEFYNIARRAKKEVVLLVYGGEDHSNRRKPNQLDYQRRIVQWFGHDLKGEPAEPWMTSGVSFLEREKELEKFKK